MTRQRRPLLTERDLWDEGPPVRVRDLAAITGLSAVTVRADIVNGVLRGVQSHPRPNAPYLVQRADARAYLLTLGFHQHAC